MKIIHITQHLGIGGLEKIILHLALEQKAQNHDVSIFVYDDNKDWVSFFQEEGLHVISYHKKKTGLEFQLFKKMYELIKNVDIVHTHDLNPFFYIALLRFFCRLTFIKCPPFIQTTHGLSHLEKNTRYYYIEKFATHFAHFIIGVSSAVCDFYKKELHVTPKKVHLIENGLAIYQGEVTAQLRAQKKHEICQQFSLDENRPLILSLSRIVPLKNQLFLINAIKKRPHYQLLIVGPIGDVNYGEELLKNQGENIVFTGPSNNVNDFHLGADLYASASLHEGLPVAVLESLSVLTPCLCSHIKGHIILNKDRKRIFTFSPDNEVEFLQKTDEILRRKFELFAEMHGLKEDIINHYSHQKMTNEYIYYYQKAIKNDE